MKLTIKITKEVLQRSMMCRVGHCLVTQNCAIAVAVRDVFPKASVVPNFINLNHINEEMELPLEATKFIREFDALADNPEKRLKMTPFDFEIDVPDKVIDSIGIEEAISIINKSETLELVNQ